MFPHIITMNGKFYIRRWNLGFQYWGAEPLEREWWMFFPENWRTFDTKELAVEAWRQRQRHPKFVGFL